MMRGAGALEVAGWRPSADGVGWLTLALVLVVAPHLPRLPVWIPVTFTALALWRWWILRTGAPGPGPWLTALAAFAAVVGVGLEYRSLLGRDAGVALLTVLAAMKLLETRTARDCYVTVFLAFFLVITNFLYSQSIATGLYMVAVTVMIVAAMIAIAHPASELGPRPRLRLAISLAAQALPVMLVLFVLFPRIPGPLWGLPKDAHAGTTGLSDSMSPGDISMLSRSSTVAFRVAFDGPPPAAAEMYWRGPVLERSDGRQWRRTPGRLPLLTPGRIRASGAALDYEVTLEPTQNRWVFALEMPAQLGLNARVNSLAEMRVRRPVRERIRYRVSSRLAFTFAGAGRSELERALELPRGFHLRARRLAAEWRRTHGTADAIVEAALGHFREQPFVYTLTPPLLTGDAVDEFLFLSRRGFCEHFAAAFTILMRAAGIPARVVTGYQGGEWNEVGGYWIVRSRDAHAWSEVWLDGRGWTRVDPTAAVSPDRIEQGLDVAFPEVSGDALLGLSPGGSATRLWRRLRLGWDAVNDSWNQWVLGYGPQRQQRFLDKLGLDARDWQQMGLLLLVVVGTVLTLVALWATRRRAPVDRVARAYATFCARLEKCGVERGISEGPVDFAARAGAQLPRYREPIEGITALYVAARYADQAGAAEPLVAAVRLFRPTARPAATRASSPSA